LERNEKIDEATGIIVREVADPATVAQEPPPDTIDPLLTREAPIDPTLFQQIADDPDVPIFEADDAVDDYNLLITHYTHETRFTV
jgi:hypothetical protein